MTTVKEVNDDKTKVADEFFFEMFRSFALLPTSVSKLIYNRCTCKLIIKTMAANVYMHINNCVCVFMF